MQLLMGDLDGRNFVELVVSFLDKQVDLVHEMSAPMAIKTAIQALKTLAEFAQGPCEPNQQLLLEIGFL